MLFNDFEAAACLRSRGLFITQNRLMIMYVLLQQTTAISIADIIHFFPDELDRVSVHRSLHAFVAKRLVRIIPNTDVVVRFLLVSKATAINKASCIK